MKQIKLNGFILHIGTTTEGKDAGFIEEQNSDLYFVDENVKKQFVDHLAKYDGKDDVFAPTEQEQLEEIKKSIGEIALYKEEFQYFTPYGNNLCGDFSYQDGKVMYKGIEVEKATEEAGIANDERVKDANDERAKDAESEGAKNTDNESNTNDTGFSISLGNSKGGNTKRWKTIVPWVFVALLVIGAGACAYFFFGSPNKSSDPKVPVEAVQKPDSTLSTNSLLADNKTAEEQNYDSIDGQTEEEEDNGYKETDNEKKTGIEETDNEETDIEETDIRQRLAGYYKNNDTEAIESLIKKGTKGDPFGGTQLIVDDSKWIGKRLLDFKSINEVLRTMSIIEVDMDDNGKLDAIYIGKTSH